MTRKQKLMLNSIMSLVYQGVSLVCGFILPRMFLSTYGSTVNGLISSITQFLGFIALCEMGVGAVVQSALYKPLADNDIQGVSKIFLSSEKFFKKIAYIFIAYIIILIIVYPHVTLDEFDYGYTILLIVVMSISTFAQYYFGMTYRLLLSADQLAFIHFTIHSITIVLNTVMSILLMYCGVGIHIVKLSTSLIYLLQPLCVSLIAKRRYSIDRNIVLTDEPIKQKWNGLAQHLAAVVLGNTDTVVLTLLSTLENVSIYAVYNLVVNGIKQIVLSLTNGMQAMIGNMIAKNETKTLDKTFELYEWIIHTGVTIVFSITAFLLVPFVSVYTKGIVDVDYINPVFAIMITLAQATYCLRLPYNVVVLAAGHYKETQWSAIIEACINIVISIIVVNKYGLVGVAVGTLIAMIYRTCYLAFYLRKNIINRNIKYFLKHVLVDILTVILFICFISLTSPLYQMSELTYVAWLWLAIKVSITFILLAIPVNLFAYRELSLKIIKQIGEKISNLLNRYFFT